MDKHLSEGNFEMGNTGVADSEFGYKGDVKDTASVVRDIQERFAAVDPTNVEGYILVVATLNNAEDTEAGQDEIITKVEIGGPASIRAYLVEALTAALLNCKKADREYDTKFPDKP